LVDGRFQVGDPIEIQPQGVKGRIRGLQTHKQKLTTALPGSRVAVNLTGIDREQLARGDVIAAPGQLRPTLLLDAQYRHLADADKPLRHHTAVKLFIGAAERMARVRLIGARQLEPGETGWLQLAVTEPVAASRGDRFILRRPSPGATIGGGQILDPHPGRRYRRFRPESVERLATLAAGSPAELLFQAIKRHEPIGLNQLKKQADLDLDSLPELLAEGQIVQLGEQLFTYPGWQKYNDRLLALLADHEANFPLRAGMSREAARSQLKLAAAAFNPLVAALAADGRLAEEGAILRTPDHAIRFTAEQETAINQLMAQFQQGGVNSPSVKEARAAVGDDVYYALVDLGRLKPISSDVVYAQTDYAKITAQIVAFMRENGLTTTAQIRDLLQTSRKYAIALLEHLDEQKITRRLGDDRELILRNS
jgi:selenocysteine-specific elongation factor